MVATDLNQILAELRAERDHIDGAIAALEALNGIGRRRGRPAGSTGGQPPKSPLTGEES